MRIRKFNDGCLPRTLFGVLLFLSSLPLDFPAVQMPLALASSLMFVLYEYA